jgi:hypothetical protein
VEPNQPDIWVRLVAASEAGMALVWRGLGELVDRQAPPDRAAPSVNGSGVGPVAVVGG